MLLGEGVRSANLRHILSNFMPALPTVTLRFRSVETRWSWECIIDGGRHTIDERVTTSIEETHHIARLASEH